MKCLHYILTFTLAFTAAETLMAQQTTTAQQARRTPSASVGGRANNQADSNLPELTVRAQELNERLTQDLGNPRWSRVIYREMDLLKETNAPLYYPTRTINNMSNLFTRIFKLMGENKLVAYEYLDGYEAFDEEYKIDFKELLDRFYILYEEKPGPTRGNPTYEVNESDIPSEQVRAYYIKEEWYFDQNTSAFDVRTIAICPILTVDGDIGETRMPMFWLPYENIRPYISSAYIMTSNTNNTMTFTIDDYFRRRMFEGEIVKTQNLLNQPLQAYCPTPDSLKNEQARIEEQLIGFEENLWITPDTLVAEMQKETEKKVEKKAKTVKAEPLKESNDNSSTGVVKSVRRRR